MNNTSLARLLRQAQSHCPAPLAKRIEAAVGPQPEETPPRETLVECTIEAADARDIDDTLHYATRILNLDSGTP